MDLLYNERNGGIVRVLKAGDVDRQVLPVTNFIARVTRVVARDDGEEVRREFVVEAELDGRRSSFTVPASRFHGLGWVVEELGPRAIIYPGQREHARAAIQSLSTGVLEEQIYTHTGWRHIEGRWMYLHRGGAVDEDGPVPLVRVDLDEALAHYELRPTAHPEVLKDAVRASLRMLDLAPAEIGFPLLSATYRAALGPADFVVFIAGPTGVFKTATAALMQQHYGAVMDASHLPASFASTSNAIETLMFYAKDALMVIDDFAPNGSASDLGRYHSVAERVVRAAANNQGRSRLGANGNLRPRRFPRGLILATGEDIPRGHSIRARALIIEVAPGDVKIDVLTACQHAASAGLFATAMGGFVRWIAGDYEVIQTRLRDRAAELRAQARASAAHARTPGIIAELQAGFEVFLSFAVDASVMTAAQRDELSHRCWQALRTVAAKQGAYLEAADPARRFIALLGAGLATGRIHLASLDGDAPDKPNDWGWREANGPSWVPRGTLVGWTDGQSVYLESTVAYLAAQELAGAEPLAISETALRRRLREAGMLASADAARKTLLVRRVVAGLQRAVLHLRASVFVSGDESKSALGMDRQQRRVAS